MEIKRLHKPSYFQLQNETAAGEPLLITGVLDQWPEVMSWTPEYFKRKHADKGVFINKNITEQEVNQMVRSRLGQYINWMQAVKEGRIKHSSNYYFAESKKFLLNLGLEPLLDARFQTMLPQHIRNNDNLKTFAFWIGPKGSLTGFHYDTDYRNYLALISGKKLFLLVNPKYNHLMYPSQRYERGSNVSEIDIWRGVDLNQFPKFKDVKVQQVIVNPGDLLYVPAKWYHAVKNLDTTVAASLRYECYTSNYLVGLAEELKYKLHCAGLYRSRDNCVCHATDTEETLPSLNML